jgi:hypothetical protein
VYALLAACALTVVALQTDAVRVELREVGRRQAFLVTQAAAAFCVPSRSAAGPHPAPVSMLRHWGLSPSAASRGLAAGRAASAVVVSGLGSAAAVTLLLDGHVSARLPQPMLLVASGLLFVLLGWAAASGVRGLAARRPVRVAAWLVLVNLVQAVALLAPVVALHDRQDLPPVDVVEALAVFLLGRTVGQLPLSPGGLVVSDGVIVYGLSLLGVPVAVGLLGVLAWRLVQLPQPVSGLVGFHLWRRSVRSGAAGLAGRENRAGRWLHRTWYALVASGPWRATVLRRTFDAVHRGDDPWGYGTSDYEHRKAESVVDVTRGLRPSRILEVGASDGRLAARLLEQHPQAHLLAVDVAPAAVEAARRTLARFGGRAEAVVADVGRLRENDATAVADVDLLVLSEVLYYLGGPAQVRRTLARLSPALSTRAHVLMVHPCDDAGPLHRAVLEALGLRTVLEVVAGDGRRPVTVTLATR